MKFSVWLVGLVAATPMERLRYLHDKLIECLPVVARGDALSEETKSRLVSSGLRFTRNEAQRELDAFIDVYKIADGAGVGKADLDDMRWAIAACLLEDRFASPISQPLEVSTGSVATPVSTQTEAAESLADPVVETEEEIAQPVFEPLRDQPVVAVAPVEIVPELEEGEVVDEPATRKRKFEESEDPEEASIKTALKDLCLHASYESDVALSIRFLSDENVEFAQEGKWGRLLFRYDNLVWAGSAHLVEIFCDTYRVLLGRHPVLSMTREEKQTEKYRIYRKQSLMEVLGPMVKPVRAGCADKQPSDRLELRLLNMAEHGNRKGLFGVLNLLLAANLEVARIGRIFCFAYRALKSY